MKNEMCNYFADFSRKLVNAIHNSDNLLWKCTNNKKISDIAIDLNYPGDPNYPGLPYRNMLPNAAVLPQNRPFLAANIPYQT